MSRFTLGRVQEWAGLPEGRTAVVPNAVDLTAYTPGPKRADLLARYGLTGKRVVLTMGRMSASERYKGHDEMLAVLPTLVQRVPDVAWLVAGDGDDRPRLEAESRRLGVSGQVVWAGYVPDEEKLDTIRLADAFAMPGRGEGFGIVYLEALACGVPVVASSADASGEAVLDGTLGAVVDPDRPADLIDALVHALGVRHGVPATLATFGTDAFRRRWQAVLSGLPVPALTVRPPEPVMAHA